MRSLRVAISLGVFVLLAFAGVAVADYTIKDGNSAAQTVLSFVCATTKICPAHVIIDSTGAEKGVSGNPVVVGGATSNASSAVATSSANQSAISYLYGFNGASWDQLQVDGSKSLKINCITGCGGSGGTASNFGSAFPTPGTAIGFSDGANMVAGKVVASGADATSNTNTELLTGAFNYFYNGTAWDRTRGDTTNGVWANIKTSVLPTGAAASANQPTNAAIASTTSGQTGNLHMGAVTTSAPTYTNGQTDPLSLTVSGALRIDGSGATQPVSGTVTANQGGAPWSVNGAVSNASSAVATSSSNVPAIAYLYGFNGTTFDQLQVDASKFLKVNCAAGCTGASDTNANLSGMTANNAATSIALVGTNSVGVLLSGTWVGTLTPEVSADGGTTWVATSFYNANTHATAATVTANGTYQILGTGGMSNARVRISAYTSGTVTGNLKAVAQAPSANDAQSQISTATGTTADTAYAGSGTASVIASLKGIYNAMTGAIPAGTNTIGKVGIDQTTPGTTNGVQVNAALPAGTNVLGKVSIDQTTPGTTNLVALAANQSVNLAQVGGVATPVGSGVQATAPRMTLATDSPGIVTLGATTKSASVPVAWATDQVGTAGTANASVVTVQGIASMTPIVANSTNGYPSGAIAETASATGTTAATTATLAASVGKTTYICGFSMRSVATAAAAGNATVTGTITGTLNFTHGTGATPTVVPNDQRFSPCVPASATNTAIAVVSPAAGTGGVMSVTAWGFQL